MCYLLGSGFGLMTFGSFTHAYCFLDKAKVLHFHTALSLFGDGGWWGGWGGDFQAISQLQLNYTFGCFVVEVVVSFGL